MSKGERMLAKIRRWYPAIVCILFYIILVVNAAWVGTESTGGQLVYPLDDTYIHMAIAKNFAEHGVWGITQYAFSSSTSSPLYTGILAATYMVTGSNTLMPLIFNLIFGTVFIIFLHRLLRRLPRITALIILLAISYTISLPALSLLGMEHTLHLLLSLLFVFIGGTVLSARSASPFQIFTIVLLAILLPITRYEACFAVAFLSVFLALQKRFLLAFALAAAGAVPILLYGLVSHMQGWLFLPNSILLKGTGPDFSSALAVLKYALGLSAIRNLAESEALLVVLVLSVVACFQSRRATGGEKPKVKSFFLCKNNIHRYHATNL